MVSVAAVGTKQQLSSSKTKTTSTVTQPAAATPSPAPQPIATQQAAVTTTTYASGCTTYDSIFRQYAWNVSVAEAICMAESSGNPYAESYTSDDGLMQIHDGLYLYGTQIFNPTFNIQVAYQKYVTQGWEAWSTYNSGAYEAYL